MAIAGLRVGFIGAGNMADAIVRGLLKGLVNADQVTMSDVSKDRLGQLQRELGICVTDDNEEVIRSCNFIFLSVKPQATHLVLKASMRDLLVDGNKVLVSIVAGQTTDFFLNLLSATGLPPARTPRIVRVMPNTPFLVGEGAVALCQGTATKEDLEVTEKLMHACAKVVIVLPNEDLLHVVTALSGSGPGYILAVIEAMVEAGVRGGLAREAAFKLAAQTVLGTGALAIDAEKNNTGTPAELRERVTSKGGTTAAGLAVLNRYMLQDAFLDCIGAAAARSRELARL